MERGAIGNSFDSREAKARWAVGKAKMPRGRIKPLISVDFLNIEDNASVLYISRWDLDLSVVYNM